MGPSRAPSWNEDRDWLARQWAESLAVVLRELGSGPGAERFTVRAVPAEAPGALLWWEQPIASGEPASTWIGLDEEFASTLQLPVPPEELLESVFASWAPAVAERYSEVRAASSVPRRCPGPGNGEHFVVQVPCEARQVEIRLVLPLSAAGGEVLDVAVLVTASLGRLRMPLEEALRLGPGSVIPLNRPTDAPVELEIQDVPVARGRLVALGDAYGIKVEELLRSLSR